MLVSGRDISSVCHMKRVLLYYTDALCAFLGRFIFTQNLHAVFN